MGRPRRRTRIATVLALAGLAAGAVLAARTVNSPTHGVRSAPGANTPECRRVVREYPARLAGLKRTDTGGPGVAVWGDGAITARCGLEPPAPTTDACVTVNDVAWVWRPHSANGDRLLVTYGRDPAVELTVSGRVAAVDEVLVQLSALVKPIASRSNCIGEDDVAG
ncbi:MULTISPECIES: DUF3515 family protein [unclassified Streptomyces]|uniref:DUF3515 family protein n=1 Tax=unclassified Streptomyces TaxID=2593676 RepID=UPI000FFEEBE5|nr:MULTISPECIES: DUF3515 family protein [unclassified Streptomyces]